MCVCVCVHACRTGHMYRVQRVTSGIQSLSLIYGLQWLNPGHLRPPAFYALITSGPIFNKCFYVPADMARFVSTCTPSAYAEKLVHQGDPTWSQWRPFQRVASTAVRTCVPCPLVSGLEHPVTCRVLPSSGLIKHLQVFLFNIFGEEN